MGRYTNEQINKVFGDSWWKPEVETGTCGGKVRAALLRNKYAVNNVVKSIDEFIDMFGSSILKADLQPQWPPRSYDDYDGSQAEPGDASYRLAVLRRMIALLDKFTDELIDKVRANELGDGP